MTTDHRKTMFLTPIEEIEPGDIIAGGPDRVPCAVLTKELGVETVTPLAGRPVWRLWCRRLDTGQEGEILCGPGGAL